MIAHPIFRVTLFPFCKIWLRRAEGMENVPMDKPFIVAANNASYYDTILIHSVLVPKLNKKLHAFTNSLYWKFPIMREVLNSGECIPVYVGREKNTEKNKQAIQKALGYLNKGGVIEIFPEGTRSPDGKLKKAHTGIAKLALKAKVPVLPFGIRGSHKVLPKGKILPHLVRCEVKIGKLLHFDKYYNKKLNNKIYEDITRSIMKEIAKLIGQEYEY